MRRSVLSIALAAVLCVGLLAGCKGSGAGTSSKSSSSKAAAGLTVSGAGQDKNARYDAKGNVTIAINKNRSTDFQALLDQFSSVYKNIDIQVDYFDTSGGSPEYLSAKASAGKLPDIVFDDYASLPYYISQGWVYPLSGFVKNDPDFTYVPESVTKSFTYNNRLYALPDTIQFTTIFLNDDIMDALNLDHPDLDWNVNDYAALLKAATNNTYSGTETLFDLDIYLAGVESKNETIYSYNYDTRKFDLNGTWKDTVAFMRKLREYPGLEAWSLRWNNAADGKSNYVAKFGQGNTDDTHMAFKMGKTLSDSERGTWDAWLNELTYKWELWPYPQAVGQKGRFPMHVDYSFMTTGVSKENTEAAFQVLRYMTYSTEGNLARLSMFDEANAGKYTLNNEYYIPATNQPDVAAKFKSLPKVTKAIAYMYDNMATSFRADPNKIVPSFDDVTNDVILTSRNEVPDGKADAAAVAAEVQDKANAEISKKWAEFDTARAKAEQEFDAAHPDWNK